MYDDARAIEGDYANFKLVQTRKVCQLIVEIPIEEAEEVTRLLGFPNPGAVTRCAVIRLNETMGGAPTRKDGGDASSVTHTPGVPATPPAKPGPKPSLTTGPAGGAAPQRSASAAPPKPNSTRAVMMAKNEEFWKFLTVHYGLKTVTDERSADQAIKFLCGVQSKSELNDREKAAAAFDRLRSDFKHWMHGAPAQ